MRPGAIRKGLNVSGLLVGFALGQGALFALNTYLVAIGELGLVGELGLAIGFLYLFLWILDLGGVYYLTRAVVENALEDKWRQVILGRLCLGVPVSLAAAATLLWWPTRSLELQIMLTALVLIGPIWAFNLLGLLEGRDLAGVGGLFNNLAVLLASSQAAFQIFSNGVLDGTSIGIAFAIGALMTVIVQYVLLVRTLRMISLRSGDWWPRRKIIVEFLRFGIAFSLSHLPAQAYARLVILLISQVLGSAVCGVYVYVKGVVNIWAQVVTAVRRVEFRALTAMLAKGKLGYWEALARQRMSLYFGAVFIGGAVAVAVAATGSEAASTQSYGLVLGYLPAFSLVFGAWVVASGGGNYLIACNRVLPYARINLALTSGVLVLTALLLDPLGLYVVAVLELAMHIAQIFAYSRVVQER